MPTTLTRTFRPTVPGAVARSNLQSGVGLNPEESRNNYGTGQGYGTGQVYPNVQPPRSSVLPPYDPKHGYGRGPRPEPAAAPATPSVPLARTPPTRPGAIGTPSKGGTITRNGVSTAYAPTPAPDRSNKGGTMTRNLAPGVNAVTVVPPSPAAIRSQMTPALPATMPAAIQPALDTPGTPVTSPTTSGAAQTESANPLSGDGNAQPEDTTDAINPGDALGLNRRGASTPQGSDALPQDPNTGGSGLYARKFSNPKSASVYGAYVKKLFPGV